MIIAHRGFRSKKGENRMIDFAAALKHTKGVEFDIRLTKDKKIIIFHDDNFERIGNEKISVISQTYEQITKLNFFNNNPSYAPPLFIEDFCENLASKYDLINVEIKWDHYSKDDYAILLDSLNILREKTKAEIIVSSFYLEDLDFISKLDNKKFKRGYLFVNKNHINYDLFEKFDYIHPGIKFLLLSGSKKFIKKHNMKVNVWTITNSFQARIIKMIYRNKITNYISDTPKLKV